MSAWDSVKRFSKHLAVLAKCPSWQLSFAFIGFLVGVAVHSWIDSPLSPDVLVIAGLVVLTIAFVFMGKRKAILFFSIAGCLLGLWRYSVSFPSVGPSSVATSIGSTVRLEGTINNDPSVSSSQQELDLTSITINGQPVENGVAAFVAPYPMMTYGYRVSFRCPLKQPVPSNGFPFDRYLLRVGIVATCFSTDEPQVLSTISPNILRSALYDLRHMMQSLINKSLPEPEAAVASGLLLGTKNLPDDLAADFRAIGVSHIFAASGSNVAMLLVLLTSLVAYFVKRQKAFYFLLGAIVIYVVLAGAEAAVVRAGIMAATVLIATHTGRATSPRNLILLAATAMLIVNPRLLRDDVGFQLSMLATTGMAVLSPRLNKAFAFLPKTFAIRESLSTTVSATVFTLPIMILNFHQFSFISPIANLLILPFVPYAMAFTAIAAFAAAIDPALGVIIGGLGWGTERIIILIAQALASI